MGLLDFLLKMNNYRKALNNYDLVKEARRDSAWFNKITELKINYQNELQQIQFGKFISKSKNINLNKDLVSTAFTEGKINNIEYQNLKLNQNLLIEREKHPIIYFTDTDKILFFTTKTSSSYKFKKPIKDEMVETNIKEYITVAQLLHSKNAYLSNATYVIELKNTSDLNEILVNIENDDFYMNKFFSNKDLILLQKEKAFEIFYKTTFKQEPEKLSINLIMVDEDWLINDETLGKSELIDVTFDKYLKDNVDRISNYENYKNESWMSFLHNINNSSDKNDPSDI